METRRTVRRHRLRALRVLVVLTGFGVAGCTDTLLPPTSDPNGDGPDPSKPIQLAPLDVTACQYGGIYPDCQLAPSPSGPPQPTPEPGPTVGPPGTSPGTGGGSPGPTPVPADSASRTPCDTKDPIVDTPAVQAGMDALWKDSNPDAPMAQRRERGGWILSTATGYAFQPFPSSWTIGACGIDIPAGSTVPPGAVAWVHTHPYAKGEKLTACDSTTIVIGGQAITAYTTYLNDPSGYDGDASLAFGVPGIMIDKDGITRFDGDSASQDRLTIQARFGRCGY